MEKVISPAPNENNEYYYFAPETYTDENDCLIPNKLSGAYSEFKSFIKSNKIPEYAREYKREYQFIRGLNKEFKYFVDNIDNATTGLFESHRVDGIKYSIKRFLRAQEKGKFQDISNFEIYEDDVDNLIEIEKNFYNFNQYIIFCKECYENEEAFINPYPGFKKIYDDFKIFFSKLNIIYKEVNYISDSDSENLDFSYTDSDMEDFVNILNNLVKNSSSNIESDSDSDSDDF